MSQFNPEIVLVVTFSVVNMSLVSRETSFFSQVLHGASCIASNTHIPRVLLPKCSGYMYLLHISVPQCSASWVLDILVNTVFC